MSAPKNYCLGFIFDIQGERVILKKKNRPDWQRNKFNGVGGHIEGGETPVEAMVRECNEEVGWLSDEERWHQFCILSGNGFIIHIFCIFATDRVFNSINSADDEPVLSAPTNQLPAHCIQNVRWMIPMALSFPRGEDAKYFTMDCNY